jgi:DNA-binding MarR family transcriptional regulator
MPPDRQDIEQLAAALFAVADGLQRARRRIPDAANLSVLQILAWAERTGTQPVRPSDIASALDTHRSAVTQHLKSLEDAGHVTLTADARDRRSWNVHLTDAGRAEVERLTAIGLDRYALFVADWDADDVRTLTNLLMRFAESRAAAPPAGQPPATGPTRRRRHPSDTGKRP